MKCLYRGYTDATFAHLKARPATSATSASLGPVIRAEVGDTIKVVFRNTCPFPTSIHPHGVFYDKSSEGAPYNDGTHGAKQGRRRRADRRHAHLHLGGAAARRARAPTTAAR